LAICCQLGRFGKKTGDSTYRKAVTITTDIPVLTISRLDLFLEPFGIFGL